ncbi:hypothetical protein DQ04_10041020 [Trypanosoma grayi]|uniref:hypothetical protein n=1 Tax=Trypanosoma grayi TaxID=71804 RepID=UPI0004F3F806|nr:hypothetical protein DQ04_10041020 [Trypanosoma grayi]KEG07359.1 hypothetical protein DQ04_10041020 [Trypanosoma grayi]
MPQQQPQPLSLLQQSSPGRPKQQGVRVVRAATAEENSLPEAPEPPIPTSSLLRAGTYKLTVERLDGLDIQVPLNDLSVSVEEFHLITGLDQWLLESVGKHEFQNIEVCHEDAASFVINFGQPVEFTVRKANSLHVFIIVFLFKRKPLFWAGINARGEGVWMGVLRRPPVDVPNAMQVTDSCLQDTIIRGAIEGNSSNDVLNEAERHLNSVSIVNAVAAAAVPQSSGKKEVDARQQQPSSSASHPAKEQAMLAPTRPAKEEAPLAPTCPAKEEAPLAPTRPAKEEAALVPTNPAAVEKLLWKIQFDDKGRVVVPANYKNIPVSKESLSNLDIDSQTDASLLFGFRSLENEKPQEGAVGHGNTMSNVDVGIRCVYGLPLNAACSRLLVYVCDYIDEETGEVMSSSHDAAVLMRPPNAIHYQDMNGSCTCPFFEFELKDILVGDETFLIVIIEYITAKGEGPFVFGHVGLPVHKCTSAGNFVSRVRLGDPRRPESRGVELWGDIDAERQAMENYTQEQIEETLDAQALFVRLFVPSTARSECCPCGYIAWYMEADPNSLFFDDPMQPPLSRGEEQLFDLRQGNDHHMVPPFDSVESAAAAFQGSAKPMGNAINYVVPYDPERGFFISVEELHGMGNSSALYAVAVETGVDGPNGLTCTRSRDWFSDVGAPRFSEPLRIITGANSDPFLVALFFLLRATQLDAMTQHGEAQVKVETVGWSMFKLFLDDGALRHGRYALPWFDGSPPDALLDELETQPLQKVFASWYRGNKLKFSELHSTVVISIGDPLTAEQLVVKHPGRPQPTKLFVPSEMKPMFPSVGCEGAVGYTQQQLLSSLELTVAQAEEMTNACFEAYVNERLS